MKKTIFKGAATALVTPIDERGVDYDRFARLIDWQIDEGINALVICGTTGEASTLSDEEHIQVIDYAVKHVNKRVPVIAGTGSNDTKYAQWLIKEACASGADAMLLVTPYYNKATQNGLVKMFSDLADSSEKPIILYNVPSRTGCNIEPSTYKTLSKHGNIAAIKEANGNISKIVETMSLVGDDLDLYSGNDDQVLPLLALGAKGVISVLSNVLPKKTVEMCDRYFSGDLAGSIKLQFDMLPLIQALFSEVNPIPVKAAMAAMGYCENYLRLPLTPMEEAHYEVLVRRLRENGINV